MFKNTIFEDFAKTSKNDHPLNFFLCIRFFMFCATYLWRIVEGGGQFQQHKAHSQDRVSKDCLSTNTFTKVWKKATAVSAHKIRNYVFIINMFVNLCQSGFSANEIFINQLVPVAHDIYFTFNCNLPLKVPNQSLRQRFD